MVELISSLILNNSEKKLQPRKKWRGYTQNWKNLGNKNEENIRKTGVIKNKIHFKGD